MKLNTYIRTFPRRERIKIIEHIAKQLSLKIATVRSMISGARKIEPKYAILLEKATKGQVRCHESCPKYYPKPYNWH